MLLILRSFRAQIEAKPTTEHKSRRATTEDRFAHWCHLPRGTPRGAQSFPRRRESTSLMPCLQEPAQWIPAFAGMTACEAFK
jgi:hypothetical protein